MRNVYSVRDAKAEAFSPPFLGISHGEAVRSFEMLCKTPDNMIAKFPADFALFHLGTFDEQKGVLMSATQPLQIALAVEYVANGDLKAVNNG